MQGTHRLGGVILALAVAVVANASYVKDISGLLRQRFNHKEFPKYQFYSTPSATLALAPFSRVT
jgi:hypothetical protein